MSRHFYVNELKKRFAYCWRLWTPPHVSGLAVSCLSLLMYVTTCSEVEHLSLSLRVCVFVKGGCMEVSFP